MPESEILPECKIKFDDQGKDIVGIRKSLFGDDGLGGVCGCLKNKVSKKVLLVIALAMTGFIIAGLTAWGGAKDERKENKQSISLLRQELVHIKETTDSIEQNLMDPKELLRAIKRIVKGNDPMMEEGDG